MYNRFGRTVTKCHVKVVSDHKSDKKYSACVQVVHLMERQQKRTQQTVLLSALTLVILAPVAVWALGNNI